MNSLSLKEKGFTETLPLKNVAVSNLPQNKSGVFVIVENNLEKTTSNILFIGKTKKIAKRISRRIHRWLWWKKR